MAGDFLSRILKEVDVKPDVLRVYAGIFETPRRDGVNGFLTKPGPIGLTVAQCLRIVADMKDLELIRLEPESPMQGESVTEFVEGSYLK